MGDSKSSALPTPLAEHRELGSFLDRATLSEDLKASEPPTH